jgi:glycine cleavage system transcriptional repressor
MTAFAIFTAIGSDRVGIVDDLTAQILERRCNVEESRMTVLGGEFAVMLLVSGQPEEVAELLAAGPAIGQTLGLLVATKQTTPPRRDARMRPYQLESVSLDTPGILHSVTSLLRGHGINIEDLETETSAAPWTGAPMFLMRARLSLPPAVSPAALREELEALEAQQNLDVRLTPIAPAGPADR